MASNKPSGHTFVALLRGINVGGRHIVPMKLLTQMFAESGCSNVRSYIQSGNVVFSAPVPVVEVLPQVLQAKIQRWFGFSVPVILRTTEEMAQTTRKNPFLLAGLPETRLHVYFLADQPSPSAIEGLDPSRSAPDEFRLCGRDIYLHVPNGMGRTKLTSAYFDLRLSTTGTARNWATVLKIYQMMQA